MYRNLLPLQEGPINLSNFENPNEEIKNYKKQQSFFYFCKGCGKQVNTTRRYWNGTFLCSFCKRKETNLRIYGVECIFQDTERTKNAMLEKYGVENPNYIDGVSEKIQKTKKQKYGEHLEKIVEKVKSTSLRKYGIENAGNTKEAREKAKQTSLRKYGTSNPAQSEIVKLHMRENNYKKYGKEHVMQVEEIKRKSIENLEKNNSRQNFGTKEFKESFKKRFGVENPSQLESVKQKKIETARKHLGVDNPFQSDVVKNKIKNKLMERYGVEHPLQNEGIFRKIRSKYVFENECFDSSWELALWIYAKDHNEEIERSPCSFEYEFEGQTRKYFPDFRYKGELVEIKGDQFFNEKGEPVIPFGEGSSWAAKYDCIKKNNVILKTSQDLSSIFSYIEETYGKNYLKSFKKR